MLDNCIQGPSRRNTSQFVLAPVDELDFGADDEIDDGPRHKNLAGVGQRLDALRQVNCKTGEIVATPFHLTGMNTDANLEAKLVSGFADPERTPNCSGRPVEGRQRAVADRLYEATTEPLELTFDGLVMAVELISPSQITQFGCLRRRVHDVCEDHGCEQSIRGGWVPRPSQELFDFTWHVRVTNPRNVICTRKFDVLRPREVINQVTAVCDSNKWIVSRVQHQCRRPDTREHRPNVGS